MKNPFSETARSYIYIIGIIAGSSGGVASAAAVLFGAEPALPLINAILSTVVVIVSVLAKANLTEPGAEVPAPVADGPGRRRAESVDNF